MRRRFFSVNLPSVGASLVKAGAGDALFATGGLFLAGRFRPGASPQRHLPVSVQDDRVCAVTHGPYLTRSKLPAHDPLLALYGARYVDGASLMYPMKAICWTDGVEEIPISWRSPMDEQWLKASECHVADAGAFICGDGESWSLVRASVDEEKGAVRVGRVRLPSPEGGFAPDVPYFPTPVSHDPLRLFTISNEDGKTYLSIFNVESGDIEPIEEVPAGTLVVGVAVSSRSTEVEPVLAVPIGAGLYVVTAGAPAANEPFGRFPTGLTVRLDPALSELGGGSTHGPNMDDYFFETPRLAPALFLPDYSVGLFFMRKSVHAVWTGAAPPPEDRHGLNEMGLGALMPEAFTNEFPQPHDIGAYLRMASVSNDSFKPPYVNVDEKPLFYRHFATVDSPLGPRLDFAPRGPGAVRAFVRTLMLAF